MKRLCENYREEELIASFVMALTRVYGTMDEFLEEHESFEGREEVLELYFQIAHFLNMYEIMDENYISYTQLLSDGDFMLKLFCVNPALHIKIFPKIR